MYPFRSSQADLKSFSIDRRAMEDGWAILCGAPDPAQRAVWLFPGREVHRHFATRDANNTLWMPEIWGSTILFSSILLPNDRYYRFVNPVRLRDLARIHECQWRGECVCQLLRDVFRRRYDPALDDV